MMDNPRKAVMRRLNFFLNPYSETLTYSKYRSNHQEVFAPVFTPVSEFRVCNFIKTETLEQVFSCEFCESFKNTFF